MNITYTLLFWVYAFAACFMFAAYQILWATGGKPGTRKGGGKKSCKVFHVEQSFAQRMRRKIGAFMIGVQEVLYFPRRLWRALKETRNCFANAGTDIGVTPYGCKSYKADAAISTRWLLVKQGTDVDHVAINAASTTLPLGVCTDEPTAAEDVIGVQLLGVAGSTVRMVASEAIAVNTLVYTAANGKVQDTPAGSSGVAFKVGRSLTAAAADGDVIEVEPCFPLSVTF